MICPNGCTDHTDTAVEMELDDDRWAGLGTSIKPLSYNCGSCGYSERAADRGVF